ncbi:MAG: hypothetical protein KAH10_02870 [Flavobacteriales bacterium]|nr:hypothetical protein [Flavobacteriales bacterium]
MLLILISWIYIFLITSTIAVGINSILKLNKIDPIINLFLGFFYITLFTGFWAIFYRVNWEFHLVTLSTSIILAFHNRYEIKAFYKNIKTDFYKLSLPLKSLFILIAFLALAKSATSPYLIDNESYYIQTIKWINEYGFVKGLVNLHPFLGQTSGWHILQAAFNFSFIYDKFNDLNGLAIIFANFFSLVKFNKYYNSSKKIEDLIIGLFPLSNIFFFQFISAPSPDIPVYIISFLIFYLFIKLMDKYSYVNFFTISILLFFIVLNKLTSLPFIILPTYIFIKNVKNPKIKLQKIIFFGGVTLILFILKNIIITGNILYPIASFDIINTTWSLPKTINSFFYDMTKIFGFYLTKDEYNSRNGFELFITWISMPKLHGLFNNLLLIILTIFPILAAFKKVKKSIIIIYILSIINLFLLFVTSPQYRFYYQFLLFFSIIILTYFIKNKSTYCSFLILGTAITLIPILFLNNISKLTNNNFHLTNPTLSISEITTPHENTRYSKKYESIKGENIEFNSPTKIDFFWGTGDIPLPALNKKQYEWFKESYHVVPQMRTDDIKDGFYSKVINSSPSLP